MKLYLILEPWKVYKHYTPSLAPHSTLQNLDPLPYIQWLVKEAIIKSYFMAKLIIGLSCNCWQAPRRLRGTVKLLVETSDR